MPSRIFYFIYLGNAPYNKAAQAAHPESGSTQAARPERAGASVCPIRPERAAAPSPGQRPG